MKILLICCSIFSAHLLFGQVEACYCYENSDSGFTEWLLFEKDSVAILAMRNKSCADKIPGLTTIDDGSLKNFKYPFVDDDGELYIVKHIDIPGFDAQLSYYYSGIRKGEDLEIHIESTHIQDMTGPPDRLYKMVEVK